MTKIIILPLRASYTLLFLYFSPIKKALIIMSTIMMGKIITNKNQNIGNNIPKRAPNISSKRKESTDLP